jgi:class 3 adenylate cyclase
MRWPVRVPSVASATILAIGSAAAVGTIVLQQWLYPTATRHMPLSYTPKYLAEQILTTRNALEGERKHVTVCFADLQGSTALAQGIDPEVLHKVLDGAFALMLAEVHRVEGTVNQFTGDGIMALFDAPLAQEDHVIRALHAALGIQRAFAAYAEELRRLQGISVALRIGLHTGLVVVGKIGDDLRMDYTAQGFTTYLADRLQRLARDGSIYVSEAVRQQAEGFFRFNDVGAYTVPGIAQPVRVYECAGVGQVTSRLAAALRRRVSQFVGREREMTLLRALWTRACHGQGQVVCLFGEAGIGKSRLAFDVPAEGVELYLRDRRMLIACRTNDGLTAVLATWPHGEFHEVRADIAGHYFKSLDLAPALAERVRSGQRVERFVGTADMANFFRKPYGVGWALVGDAGYHKDPCLAQGITDSFRDAELLAEAIDADFSGRQPLAEALADYEQQRNAAGMPMYEFTLQLANLVAPPSPEMQQLFAALCGNQAEINRFFGPLAGTVPIPEFFAPENVQRIISAR